MYILKCSSTSLTTGEMEIKINLGLTNTQVEIGTNEENKG